MKELIAIIDFDGTLYRGDAPIRYYAEVVADTMAPPDREQYLDALDRYLKDGPGASRDSEDTVEAAVLREAVDGWGAAFHLAGRCYDVSPEVIEFAFARCRLWMTKPECDIELVEPLIEALAGIRDRATLLLATNSPELGLRPLLDRLGVTSAFDEIMASTGKPDGLRRLLQRRLGADLRMRPWRVFSLGDHYRNDIEPAVEIGAPAGYVDKYGRRDGPATATGSRVEDLLPALRGWAADPAAAPGVGSASGSAFGAA
jgi:FMN phosphatase YigB (HAD superfamily)